MSSRYRFKVKMQRVLIMVTLLVLSHMDGFKRCNTALPPSRMAELGTCRVAKPPALPSSRASKLDVGRRLRPTAQAP